MHTIHLRSMFGIHTMMMTSDFMTSTKLGSEEIRGHEVIRDKRRGRVGIVGSTDRRTTDDQHAKIFEDPVLERNSKISEHRINHSPTLFHPFSQSEQASPPITTQQAPSLKINHVILRSRHPPSLPLTRPTRRSDPHSQGDERNNHCRRYYPPHRQCQRSQ